MSVVAGQLRFDLPSYGVGIVRFNDKPFKAG